MANLFRRQASARWTSAALVRDRTTDPSQLIAAEFFEAPAGGAITGTVAIAAPVGALAGVGTETFLATGALAAPVGALAAVGGQAFTGTVALTGPVGALAGVGAQAFTGTGALAGPVGSLSAVGAEAFTGTVALAGPVGSLAGVGQEAFTGTVALSAPAGMLDSAGVETFLATVDLTAPAGLLDGTGTVTAAAGDITGTVAMMASPGSFAGEGIVMGESAIVVPSPPAPVVEVIAGSGGARAHYRGPIPIFRPLPAGIVSITGTGGIAAPAGRLEAQGQVISATLVQAMTEDEQLVLDLEEWAA